MVVASRRERFGFGLGVAGRRGGQGGLIEPILVRQAAVEFGDVRDDAELPKQRALSLAAEFGFERGPVHCLAISERSGQIREPAISAHARKCLDCRTGPSTAAPDQASYGAWTWMPCLSPSTAPARHRRAGAHGLRHRQWPCGVRPRPLAPPDRPNGAPLPETQQLVREVKAGLRTDEELLRQYTFRERRRDVDVTKFGKVRFGPWREFEVYPSEVPGETYKRLVSVDNVPLAPAVLERRDAEHRKTVLDQLEQIRVETPAQRQKRLAKKARERQEEQDVIDDVFAVYDIAILGRETLDGRPTIVTSLTPRPRPAPGAMPASS